MLLDATIIVLGDKIDIAHFLKQFIRVQNALLNEGVEQSYNIRARFLVICELFVYLFFEI